MGAYLAWEPYYSVGDPALDTEHQQVILLIDELYASMASGRENAKSKEILDRLVRYTFTHFEHEEEAMRLCGYSDLQAHKILHDRMRQRTLDLRANMSLVTGCDLLYFLKDWWSNHIQAEDKQYAPYLASAEKAMQHA
jgi:hemerythrin-like metal-binding protein